MKRIPSILFVLLIVLFSGGCSKNEQEQIIPEDYNDITSSADITPYGGEIQVTDESGNIIKVTFPPSALRDTTTITLTLVGKHKDLPINEREIRAFQIQPSDLSLYEPAVISVKYSSAITEIETSAIFLMRSDTWLIPLGEHTYPAGNSSITASTLSLGNFAEGKMTIEQINEQIDLLETAMGITWKSAPVSLSPEYRASSGCEEYKAAWDDWTETADAFFKFFVLREKLGYYNEPGRGSFDEDAGKVCSNIVSKGIDAVLGLGESADPCCSDYAEAIEKMMQAAVACGMGGSTLDQMNNRYDAVHDQCHTYLDITTEVNVDAGGLMIMTTGEVILTLTGTGDGEASVTGTGELTVTGTGGTGGQCSATISGQTFVTVTGTRDAAYVYSLSVDMNQVAMMVTVCPDIVVETALVGGSSREVTLGPGNGFSISETEMIDEGTATVQVSLNNPYVPVADPQ